MAFGDYAQVFGGLFNLGRKMDFTLNSPGVEQSAVLNARDLGSVGDPDFGTLGPGSQVWIVGYSVSINSPVVLATDALGLSLQVAGSFDVDFPEISFSTEQEIILPVYGTASSQPLYRYSGHARVESPAVQLFFDNITGQNLVISYQFWGKAF